MLGCAPTGSGKTHLGAAICSGAVAKGNRILWIADRTELIDQPVAAFREHGLHVGIIQGNRPSDPSAPVQVATIQTTTRRQQYPDANIVVVDECHLHLNDRAERLIAAYPNASILGLSATPWLLNNRSLGSIYKKLVVIAQPSELIAAGILVKPRVFGPNIPDVSSVHTVDGDFDLRELEKICDKPTIVGDVAEMYAASSRPSAILFAVSRNHSRSCRDALRSAGVRAEHVDGETPADERKSLIDALKSGRIDVLCNVDILTAGFDFRGLGCVICVRPTQSLALYIQMCGRALRSSHGKHTAVIVDHSGNWLRHGYPHADHEWTLEPTKRIRKNTKNYSLRTCLQCFAVLPMGTVTCTECGTMFPVEPREVRHVNGNLTEIHNAWTREEKQAEFARLCDAAVSIGLSRQYVRRKYKEKFGMWPRKMVWPKSLPLDVRHERQQLERVAETRGYNRDANGKFPWVEKQIAEIQRSGG